MKAEELVEVVAKMTPGPWSRHGKCIGVDHEGVDHRAGVLFKPTANTHWNPKNVTGVLALRNHAVPIIAALLAERDALRVRYEAARDLHIRPRLTIHHGCIDIASWEAAHDRYVAALSTDSGEKGS